jgi:quinol-cytochrome oxidoreductase complex cytochrome b subunit
MSEKKQETFYPTFVFKEALVALVVFIVVIALAWYMPAEMGDPADPSDSAYVPKPEWYFLSMYQFLKLFPGKLEFLGLLLQPLAVILLFILPFLDRSPERRPSKRKFAMGVLIVVVIANIILGVVGYVT